MKKGFLFSLLISVVLMSSSAYAGSILWDTSHYTPGPIWDNYDRFGGFLGAADTAGYNVTRGTGDFMTADLSGYDAIVVTVITSEDIGSIYTPAEVTKISGFVNSGGGLLIVGDSTLNENDNIQPIATEFGATLAFSDLNPTSAELSFASGHPLLNNVSQLDFQDAGEISLFPPSTELVWVVDIGNQALVAAAQVGLGHVVTLGDTDLMTGGGFNSMDNLQLTLNALDYITTPVEAPEPATIMLLGLGGVRLIRRRKR